MNKKKKIKMQIFKRFSVLKPFYLSFRYENPFVFKAEQNQVTNLEEMSVNRILFCFFLLLFNNYSCSIAFYIWKIWKIISQILQLDSKQAGRKIILRMKRSPNGSLIKCRMLRFYIRKISLYDYRGKFDSLVV